MARDAVERVEPGDELIAAVVRFSSESHALAKPEKFNFYFRSSGVTRTIRVGFPDADGNAMEVMRDIEEVIDSENLAALEGWRLTPARALELGEDGGGRSFRVTSRNWVVRIVLTHERALPVPTYRVLYSSQMAATVSPNVDVFVDASREGPETGELRLAFAKLRAQAALGGPVALVDASAGWSAASAQGGHGAVQPGSLRYLFMRSDDPDDRRTAGLSTFGGSSQVQIGTAGVRQAPLPAGFDIEMAFAAVERAGGVALREQWAREGPAAWFANAFTNRQGTELVVIVTYARPSGPGTPATFRYDVATGEVRRTQ
jgi:hypothetical protein